MKTKINKANGHSGTLRTSIPKSVRLILGLQEGDELTWVVSKDFKVEVIKEDKLKDNI